MCNFFLKIMHSLFNMEFWNLELWTSQLIGNLKFSDFDIEFQSKWFGTWLSMSYVMIQRTHS